jgi:PAS domain S-box-containing protein
LKGDALNEPDPEILAESLEELFDHAPCGYLSALPDGTIVRVNQTFLAWTGYDRAAVLSGKRFRDLLTVPGRVFHDTHFGPLLQMQGSVKEVAFDLLRPGRDPLPVLVNAVRGDPKAGGPPVTRVMVFDATDRRQYERELLLARRRAEQATETERAAREQAEQANRAKDEFLALISHELRTPLNAILGWTQMLRTDFADNPDLGEGLSVIERNTRIQVQLVDDLLDMGRLTSGKMRLDVQHVDLADVVEAALETARPAADAKAIRLQKVLDPTVVVSGDPGRLQQVFWNLLSNAMKFTPRGGFVRVVMERVNSHIEVSVVDSGQGMKADFIAHAFERFRQSDTQGTRRTGGLGLGLSIVKNLVEMHGGSVRAMSEGEGEGSTFVVHLPVAVVHARDAGEERVHPRPAITDGPVDIGAISLAGVRVLVVDDERDAREMVRRALVASRAEVVAVGSAAEALEAIGRFHPHVLVSDIGMPEQDGYELIRRVRMLGEGVGGVKAVALTAFARLEDRTRAMLAGFQMHLAKPIEPSELIVTVAALAGRVNA